jgi:hypothetical protein
MIVIDSSLSATWYWISLNKVISVIYCLLQCNGPCCTYRLIRPVFLLHLHIHLEVFPSGRAGKVFLNHSNGYKSENSQICTCTSRQIKFDSVCTLLIYVTGTFVCSQMATVSTCTEVFTCLRLPAYVSFCLYIFKYEIKISKLQT